MATDSFSGSHTFASREKFLSERHDWQVAPSFSRLEHYNCPKEEQAKIELSVRIAKERVKEAFEKQHLNV